ncbi:Putative mediator of RNA polymerase II transcription subunit 24 [Frankliniella fusca]|uniref:Mediator of RNA polymerase II transcription subunit 24 n=1 Tax=Frankliniella fusca TaxID=407009 RepID=A0AAE1HDN6_9NEOP|nr:Putative mediator of RNA polymerase II transcription subunit 24 [Frankliniella fusca]
MASGEEEDRSAWKDAVMRRQQNYFQCLGDRQFDLYRRRLPTICNLLSFGPCKCHDGDGFYTNNAEINVLRKKIGFAVFRSPGETPSKGNGYTGYPKKHLRVIENILKQILELQKGDEICMSVVFVSLNIQGTDGNVVDFPVFRVPKQEGKNDSCDSFVDFQGRLYQSWDNFILKNKLPKAFWCYPKNGMYSKCSEGQVELCFGYTPTSKLGQRVLKTVDTTASILSVGVGAGAFFPPTAIPCAVACGTIALYSMVRGSCELADRGKHRQSLNDREAIVQWLSLAGSALSIGSSGGTIALKTMAKEGKVVSDLVCKIVDGVNGSSMLVNGACIVESGLSIIEAEERNTLQCFQFIASVLFFAHSVVNFKTAKALVNDNQTNEISVLLKSNVEKGSKVKTLSHIFNEPDFMSDISLNQTGAINSEMAHEAQIFTAIKQLLNNLGVSDLYKLLNMLEQLCNRWENGRYFMRAVYIVLDILKCRDVETASKILNELVELGKEFCRSRESPNDEESIESLSDIEFIPSCINRVLGSQPDEEVYHFPEDHRAWGSCGELEADEYLVIAQNVFGLANVPAANIDHKCGIACVHFKHVGYVKITSCIEDQKIIIRKFESSTEYYNT